MGGGSGGHKGSDLDRGDFWAKGYIKREEILMTNAVVCFLLFAV